MHHDIQLFAEYEVTPFVGVWIETPVIIDAENKRLVTPFVGVWIETYNTDEPLKRILGHTLRGCVD